MKKLSVIMIIILVLVSLCLATAGLSEGYSESELAGNWYIQSVNFDDGEMQKPSAFYIDSYIVHLQSDKSFSVEESNGDLWITGLWSLDNNRIMINSEKSGTMYFEIEEMDNIIFLKWNIEGNMNWYFSQMQPTESAYGEPIAGDIKLPAGLEFGMSPEEATAVSGYYYNSSPSLPDTAQLQSLGFDISGYLSGRATIGGKEASVSVYFVENKLKQVEYTFVYTEVDGSSTGNDPKCQESFDSVESSLNEKYGAKVNKQQAEHRYKSDCQDFDWYYKGTLKRLSLGAEKTTRIVNLEGNGSVYIDNTLEHFMYMRPETSYYHRHVVAYTYYDFRVTNNNNGTSVDF